MNDNAAKTETFAPGADAERNAVGAVQSFNSALADEGVQAARQKKKTAILIAGMHRSGTSALARMLSLLGCDLPKTLLPGGPGNEPGHWESWPILTLNDEILASAGSSWDEWEAFNPAWPDSPVKDGFFERVLRTIEDEFGASRLFVLKDPRICRLLPFWIEALEAFGAMPHIVCPLRHPIEVAASLKRRDGIDPSVGQLLWLRHVLDAEAHSRGLRRSFLRYEAMLAGWQALPDRLGGDLGIAWPRRSSAVDIEIDGFLSPAHRHHAEPDTAVLGDPTLSRWIRSSFEIFDRWARGDARDGDRDELDHIRLAFDEAAPAFAKPVLAGRQAARRSAALEGELAAARAQSTALEGAAAAWDAKLAQRDAELAEAHGRISELEGAVAARDAELARRDAELAEIKSRIGELEGAVAARDAELARRDTELAETKGRIGELEGAATARDAELARRDAELAENRGRIGELEGAVAARDAELARRDAELAENRGRICELEGAVAPRDAELARRDAELAETKGRIGELEGSVAARDAELARRDAELAETKGRIGELEGAATAREAHVGGLQRTVTALRGSTSWKVTAPLRWAGLGLRRARYSAVGYPVTLGVRALMTMSRAPLRDFRAARAIRRSELFDRDWYIKTYPDVAALKIDPIRHYIAFGAREDRDPGPNFSTRAYLAANPDVAEAGVNALSHYVRFGASEGRRRAEPEETVGARSYADWIARYDTLGPAQRERLRAEIAGLPEKPTISVLMPVYNTDPRWLAAAITSVKRQLYPHWELCISDDASTLPGVHELLHQEARDDPRIKLHLREKRGHISANTNSALALASAEFVALLDADDELTEDALYWIAREITAHPDVDMLFSDEDKIDETGRRFDPYFKSDWNPALMMSQNAFSHLGVFRRSLVLALEGLREGYEGAQDHDLALRSADASAPERIRHIPRILYHWRVLPESTAGGISAKPYAWEAGCQSICDHLERHRVFGNVRQQFSQFYQVLYYPPATWPHVNIILPSTLKTNISHRCLKLLLEKTSYPNFSVLLMVNVANASRENTEPVAAALGDPRVRLVTYERTPFNYSWVNNQGVIRTDGDYICFLNDDVEVISPDWLELMICRALQKGVGAVGPMLYYPNDTVQHAGVILGMGGVADHAFRHQQRGAPGYFGRAGLEQDLSCVTAACMVVRREVFEGVGRFDEHLPCAFNDVDLCLRLRRDGWRIIWTPAAELYHHESLTFGYHASPERLDQFQRDVIEMRRRWRHVLDADAFYNPNLALEQCNQFDLAYPPRITPRAFISGNRAEGPVSSRTAPMTYGVGLKRLHEAGDIRRS